MLLLQHGLGASIWHQGALRVAQQLLVRYRELHYVRDLPERITRQKGQSSRDERPRAHVATSGEDHLLALQCRQVLGGVSPHLRRVQVLGAVDVDEVLGLSGERGGPLRGFHIFDLQPGARRAQRPELSVLYLFGPPAAALSCLLHDPFPEQAAIWHQLVRVEALNSLDYVLQRDRHSSCSPPSATCRPGGRCPLSHQVLLLPPLLLRLWLMWQGRSEHKWRHCPKGQTCKVRGRGRHSYRRSEDTACVVAEASERQGITHRCH
mmetsp:Transcript_78986/g.221429  ORF Transcript_78986/g.221429 Transcript_78986/m.221429 type:complete len:264 (+) Transcript_78986:646-1437(+)